MRLKIILRFRLKIAGEDGDTRHQEDSGYRYYCGCFKSLCCFIACIAYAIITYCITCVSCVLLRIRIILLRSVQIQIYFLVWNHFSNIFFLISGFSGCFGCCWEYGTWVFVSRSKFLLGRIALLIAKLFYFEILHVELLIEVSPMWYPISHVSCVSFHCCFG